MSEGKKVSPMLPKSWKKSFNNGILLPTKMRRSNKCLGKINVRHVIIKLARTKSSRLI